MMLPLLFAVRSACLRKGRIRLDTGNEEGQALLEFTICLPILLLVVTGIFTFGIVLNNYLVLTNAVTIGAQQLALSRGQTTDPCATTVTAVSGASLNLTAATLSYTIILNGNSYSGTSSGFSPTCSSSSPTTGAAGNLSQGTPAQVTVTYPCNLAVYGANYGLNCTLKATTTELVQ
jgi:Flp pilus assembly protein TadG